MNYGRRLTEAEQSREVARILSLDWPLSPFLPVKNLYDRSIGFIWADEGIVRPIVYEANLLTSRAELEDLPKQKFKTVEEMVKAGWVGD